MAVAIVIAIAVLASVGGAIRSLRADGRPAIQPDDVDELQADWVARPGSGAVTGLATEGDALYASTDEGLLKLDLACSDAAASSASPSGTATASDSTAVPTISPSPGSASAPRGSDAPCAALWRALIPGGPLSAPVVFDGRVFAGSSSGLVYAFPTDCADTLCEPEWVGVAGDGVVSRPAVNDDFVYVTSDRLYAFPSGCGTDDRICSPVWSADIPGRPSSGSPAVGGGLVVVSSTAAGGSVYAFPAVCSARCEPVWAATTSGEPGGVSLSDGTAYVAAGGRLLAFPMSCQATCDPAWTGSFTSTASLGPGAADPPSPQGDRVYVGADDGTLWVFPATCDEHACDPVRSFDVATSRLWRPMVQGGVVYTTAADGSLHAVIDGCDASQAACLQPWSVALDGPTVAAAAIGQGAVYAGDDTGHVYAFSLPTP
jgi:outer membrane protein assembly factor BamB